MLGERVTVVVMIVGVNTGQDGVDVTISVSVIVISATVIVIGSGLSSVSAFSDAVPLIPANLSNNLK